MTTDSIKSSEGTFKATLIFKNSTEVFQANRVRMHEIISDSGSKDLAIKGFQDTINKTTKTKEINSIQFFLDIKINQGLLELSRPLTLPQICINSAGYYKLEDSPDDDDDEVDTAYAFPCIRGKIDYANSPAHDHASATFNFTVEAPNGETFDIKGGFDVYNLEALVDVRTL